MVDVSETAQLKAVDVVAWLIIFVAVVLGFEHVLGGNLLNLFALL